MTTQYKSHNLGEALDGTLNGTLNGSPGVTFYMTQDIMNKSKMLILIKVQMPLPYQTILYVKKDIFPAIFIQTSPISDVFLLHMHSKR